MRFGRPQSGFAFEGMEAEKVEQMTALSCGGLAMQHRSPPFRLVRREETKPVGPEPPLGRNRCCVAASLEAATQLVRSAVQAVIAARSNARKLVML